MYYRIGIWSLSLAAKATGDFSSCATDRSMLDNSWRLCYNQNIVFAWREDVPENAQKGGLI
jgi:hypothetical protein